MNAFAVEHDLVTAGYRPATAKAKTRMLLEAAAAVGAVDRCYLVPGRIEVFGKHTDYCGGSSLLCATEQGLGMAVRDLDEPMLRVHSLSLGKTAEVSLNTPCPKSDSWTTYPHAVARRVRRNFGPELQGVEAAIASDLPPAAGLSSSSAMITALFIALADRNAFSRMPLYQEFLSSPEALAHYLGCIENGAPFGPLEGEEGVGTSGGSQDHTAIVCSKAGMLSQFTFCPVQHVADVRWPADYLFAIGVSGVVAEKSGAAREAYNAVSRRAADILAWHNETTGSKARTLQDVVAHAPDELLKAADPALRPRLQQYIAETQRHLLAAVDALRRGDWKAFADAAHASQHDAAVGLLNQVQQTEYLAASAERLGSRGACAFGAGFGGSVWAVVKVNEADAFLEAWSANYTCAFPQMRGTFFTTRPGPAARLVVQ